LVAGADLRVAAQLGINRLEHGAAAEIETDQSA
jgi:hypothetical protein